MEKNNGEIRVSRKKLKTSVMGLFDIKTRKTSCWHQFAVELRVLFDSTSVIYGRDQKGVVSLWW